MDTPRNNTLLSKAQLDALNVHNPGGFSYLTSSSYSDASFGQPNVPRIRGQYADMFFNGMRDSFTLNGYGAPISFNSADSIDIVKGPASRTGGARLGGRRGDQHRTKMPSMTKPGCLQSRSRFATETPRLARIGGPLIRDGAGRLSFTMTTAAATTTTCSSISSRYTSRCWARSRRSTRSPFNADYVDTRYREDDGINRVNQALIDNETYLTGGASRDGVSGLWNRVDLTGTTHSTTRPSSTSRTATAPIPSMPRCS